MGLVDRIRGALGGKAKEVSARVVQSYRGHLGEELLRKQEELRNRAAELDARDENVSKREANLGKYYLIPKAYLNLLIGLAVLVAIYVGYEALAPGNDTESSRKTISSFDSTPSSEDVEPMSSAVESTSKSMSFDQCLLAIQRTATQLGVAPTNIVETSDMRMVRIPTEDGSLLVTCSRPDQKMVITVSKN